MSDLTYNVVVLVVLLVVVAAAGVYVTIFEQPDELTRLEKALEAARMEQTELKALRTEQVAAQQRMNEARHKWHARYKLFPEELPSHQVIGYLNELTATGYENFDVVFKGEKNAEGYNYHVFNAKGRGYYTDLYDLIWTLENNRNFYRVRNLRLDQIDLVTKHPETGTDRMKVMVSFDLLIEAYFGGLMGETQGQPQSPESEGLPVSHANEDLPPVPKHVLPDEKPAINPFFPLVMKQLPPNTYGLVNVEEASLVSIVGKKAVFKDGSGFRSLGVGDDVYLGQITLVDPAEGRVEARLNKGGIIDEVVMRLETGASYRQALGTVQLAPVDENNQ